MVTTSTHLRPSLSPYGAEEQPAQRPGEEPDAEGGEARDQADRRIEVGEEQLGEDERRSEPVEREVVVLQSAADGAGQGGAAEVGGVFRVVGTR